MAVKTNWKKKHQEATSRIKDLERWLEEEKKIASRLAKQSMELQREVTTLEGELEIAEAVNEFHITNSIRFARDIGEQWRQVRASMRAMYEAFKGAFNALNSQVEGGDLPSGLWVHENVIQRCENMRDQMEYLRGKGYRAVIEDQLDKAEDGPRKVTLAELVDRMERGEKIGKD